MRKTSCTALLALALIAVRRSEMREASVLLNLAVKDVNFEDFLSDALEDCPEAYMLADTMVASSVAQDLSLAVSALNSALVRPESGVPRIPISSMSKKVDDDDEDSEGLTLNVLDDEDDEEEDEDEESIPSTSGVRSPIKL